MVGSLVIGQVCDRSSAENSGDARHTRSAVLVANVILQEEREGKKSGVKRERKGKSEGTHVKTTKSNDSESEIKV